MSEKAKSLTYIKWTSFLVLGNILFLKISYFILIGVPLFAAYQNLDLTHLFEGVPYTLKLGYLSSLFISIAHMIFQGFCPQIIKRFESPNDMYRDMLEIKSLQTQYLPNDTNFSFDINHCREGFFDANHKFWFARLLVAIFYWVGVALVLWVFGERTVAVLLA